MLLSVLVVVFFAVILYQPERAGPRVAVADPGPASPSSTQPLAASPAPPLTEAVPIPEPPAAEAAPVRTIAATPRTASAVMQPIAHAAPPAPAPAPRQRTEPPPGRATPAAMSQAHPAPRASRSAFTRAEEGETLRDVAVRVYGTSDAETKLWLANRDLVDGRDARLSRGTLLRTP
jgi:hypothetical protein